MELFGYELKKKKDEGNAQSFVPPSNDGSVIEIGSEQGMGGFAATGGVIGQYVDMEGGVKNEADLVARYRTMALVPECDSAIEDIINESLASNDLDAPVSIILDRVLNSPYLPDSSNIMAIKYPDDQFTDFEEAFKKARFDLGPDKYFIWRNKFYSTNYKEEGYPPKVFQLEK